ncbi:MAG: phosphoenolpyruvate synthase, partial [Actinobacteria bacterium]|nr:phosphoenolpyruvate synthase [Actinomycetota bacterium]
MTDYVLRLDEVDETMAPTVGGKGAGLGELLRVDGVRVPAGFCVTTVAFRRAVGTDPEIERRIRELGDHDADAHDGRAAELRRAIEAIQVPADLAEAITSAVDALGSTTPLAVRSSATAEDLPTASFAGQQDSFLGIVGAEEVLHHVVRCWASLFTDRAVAYRARNGIDHRHVAMAVVVQELVAADASGVAFTAHPITGNRRVVAIEATAALGDALVSGLVDPARYEVRGGELVAGNGGVLADAQVLE